MNNTAWHYWCGAFNAEPDRYAQYLLISAHSLIKVSGVDPSTIYATTDNSLHDNKYTNAARKLGVNILKAPIYENYSKQIGIRRLLELKPDIDHLVQIDTDTWSLDPDLLAKVDHLQNVVNADWAGGNKTIQHVQNRDGRKWETNKQFSFCPEHLKTEKWEGYGDSWKVPTAEKYESFKDILKITFNADLDYLIEESKKLGSITGGFYTLRPKLLPDDFFDFFAFINFFFEDDEVGLAWALIHFGIDLEKIDPQNNRDLDGKPRPVRQFFQRPKTVLELEEMLKNDYKGIIHSPDKNEETLAYIKDWADKLLEKI